MSASAGFWRFLNTDVREIPWGEVAENGVGAIAATNDLAETVKEQAPNLKHLDKVEPFLELLDNPVTQLAISGLPFVSVGIGLLRIYLDVSKKELNLSESTAIAAQLAYLQSFEVVLEGITDADICSKLEKISLKDLTKQQQEYLEEKEFSRSEAQAIANRFPESGLAKKFSEILTEQLQQAGLEESRCQRIAEQVKWGTSRFLYEAIAEAGDSVAALAEVYKLGGRETQKRNDSIANYLEKEIKQLPNGKVFDESNPLIRFRDIYVPLTVQPLHQDGSQNWDAEPINIHDWALGLLENPSEPRKVMFVQGEAGRGKSVFCRMFANLVLRELHPTYTPLLVRLRDIIHLESNLTETLEKCPRLEQQDFVCSDGGWLSDPNSRFLIILDGFDELLLEGRASGGLEDFLKQVANFQENSRHQCLVTRRPLALQGFERLITQNKNRLERVRLEPMADEQQDQWLANWQKKFGAEEVDKFRVFLKACPKDIANDLAREPLLIYLLGRLHREGHLTSTMFEGAEERVQAKIRIYRESVKWVLEKQRQSENFRLSGLEDLDDLREVLQETALCVVQSGNETAQLTMLKNRFQDSENPVAKYLKESKDTTGQSDDKALNNLLTTFYLSPGEGDKRGSVEFAHKSFGEYLFAERLMNAFEAWTEQDRRKRFRMNEGTVNSEIYDLLGYGGLSFEIVEYLFELLAESDVERVQLFDRLHEFYLRWCEGEFLDLEPTENLPQKKMLQLRKQGVATGLKQVDIFTGLNVMILLFRLHAAAQPDHYPNLAEDDPTPEINFHPCGEPDTDSFDEYQLLKIIHYADSIEIGTFTEQVGSHLYRANLFCTNLEDANLFCTNLDSANLFGAKLSNANLDSANLDSANLFNTNLSYAYLEGAYLSNANLDSANLFNANLSYAYLSNAYLSNADLENAHLSNADLENADLQNAHLENAHLEDANINNSILLETDFRHAQNLTSSQLSSEDSPPLLCGVLLPEGLDLDPNRDWDRLAQVLHERYSGHFKTIEKAEEWVEERRPK